MHNSRVTPPDFEGLCFPLERELVMRYMVSVKVYHMVQIEFSQIPSCNHKGSTTIEEMTERRTAQFQSAIFLVSGMFRLWKCSNFYLQNVCMSRQACTLMSMKGHAQSYSKLGEEYFLSWSKDDIITYIWMLTFTLNILPWAQALLSQRTGTSLWTSNGLRPPPLTAIWMV